METEREEGVFDFFKGEEKDKVGKGKRDGKGLEGRGVTGIRE